MDTSLNLRLHYDAFFIKAGSLPFKILRNILSTPRPTSRILQREQKAKGFEYLNRTVNLIYTLSHAASVMKLSKKKTKNMNHPFLTDALTLVMFYEYFFYELRIVDLELETYNVEQHRTRNVESEGREEWEPIPKLLGASSSRNTTLVVVDLASVLGKKSMLSGKKRGTWIFVPIQVFFFSFSSVALKSSGII